MRSKISLCLFHAFAATLIGLCALLAGAAAPSHAQNAGGLAQPEQERATDKALQTPSGKTGTNEPSAYVATTEDQAVLVNGALNVPGAPKDSQTVPAKYSVRNAALDKLPTMAFAHGVPSF